MFFSPYIKTVHVHIDRAEQLAVNHRWRHLFGWSVQLTVDNETSKSWSALIYRSRKIRSPTVRQCTFYNGIWQERRRLWLDDNPVDVPRRRALGEHRSPFTWRGGVCKRNGDQPLLLQAGISRRVVLSSTCLTRLQSQSVNVSSEYAVLAGTNSNSHESVFAKHPGKTQKRWQSTIALSSFHKGPLNFRRRQPPYKMNASWKAPQSVRPAGNLARNFVNTSIPTLFSRKPDLPETSVLFPRQVEFVNWDISLDFLNLLLK